MWHKPRRQDSFLTARTAANAAIAIVTQHPNPCCLVNGGGRSHATIIARMPRREMRDLRQAEMRGIAGPHTPNI